MEIILGTIISYLVSLAAGLRTNEITKSHEQKPKEALESKGTLPQALTSTRARSRDFNAAFKVACEEVINNRRQLGIAPQERLLLDLLSDSAFQNDLMEWFKAGGIPEGDEAKQRLLQAMEQALAGAGASSGQIDFLQTGYFDALEKTVFSDPLLAQWRHQLSLDYLREQVVKLRQRADEAAGVYSTEKQQAALERYFDITLDAWDIIDLSNLPEGDIQIATQALLLRRLYMPLRIEVESSRQDDADDDAMLVRLEAKREARRQREADPFSVAEPERSGRSESRSPIGERLGAARRLVILGDPGGGKTTLLRWMATAYLLRHKNAGAYSHVPDTETLPDQPWIPVLIRCRDLGEADLCRRFTDFLTQHLHKSELQPEDANIMQAVILDRIANGEALLLVDGLDEITNPRVRVMFCQELERTAARYPAAPVVVTSRIVGYRDMPYRMSSSFEHGQIAELSPEDKDLFAERWVAVTEQHQPAAERAKRTEELRNALHSSDRIERLTGNPMLLTTLALVKRKVGKLPNRRHKLYAEAVAVLLNWNPRYYDTIEEDEAIPQLEYVAYEMCRRGVQRLAEDDLLDLLDNLRKEYPNVRAIRRRKSEDFVKLLEARSSILIKSGDILQQDRGQETGVWEFRHLTFQEYLAARALIDGRYPGRDRRKSLAEQVAPLACPVEDSESFFPEDEMEIPEQWREALRLVVAACNDDDVDDALLAILHPMSDENTTETSRPRVALAALCLADEPNVSEEIAKEVLTTFASLVGENDGTGNVRTSLDRSALEVGNSIWSQSLKESLIQEFCHRSPETRSKAGGLWGMAEVTCWRRSGIDSKTFFTGLVQRLKSDDRIDAISAALTIMVAALTGITEVVENLTESLLDLLERPDPHINHAAVWALWWLSEFRHPEKSFWQATSSDVKRIGQALDASDAAEHNTRRWLTFTLENSSDTEALPFLLRRLDDPDARFRQDVIKALENLGDKQAVPPLLDKLDDPNADVRQAVIEAMGKLGDKQAVPPLLAKLDDPDADVRRAIVETLGELNDKQAVPSLLAKLDDPDVNVRRAVIDVLVKLGDKQAIEALIPRLEDSDDDVSIAAANALAALGDASGPSALAGFLDHSDDEWKRYAAIEQLVRIRDKPDEKKLLSEDLDGLSPWIDPHAPITETRIAKAAQALEITPQEVRRLYESIAADYHLKFE